MICFLHSTYCSLSTKKKERKCQLHQFCYRVCSIFNGTAEKQCCGAFCKVPIQIYIFLIRIAPYQWKIAAPLPDHSSRPSMKILRQLATSSYKNHNNEWLLTMFLLMIVKKQSIQKAPVVVCQIHPLSTCFETPVSDCWILV